MAVLYEYNIAWSLTNQNPWFGAFFLQSIIFLCCINQKLHFTQKLWIKIIFMTIFFISDEWQLDKIWCSSNHKSSAHDFASKWPKILIRPSHCWPLRDLEYASPEQQGTLLIMSLELNMTENNLISVNLSTKF